MARLEKLCVLQFKSSRPGYVEMITLNVMLSFVAFMTETGVVAKRSGKKGGGRLRDPFGIQSKIWCLEVQGKMTKLNKNLSL